MTGGNKSRKALWAGERSDFKRGFTLYELLVVLAIVSLLSVMVVARFRAGQKNYALANAKQAFVATVRQAQSMATSGTEMPGYDTIGGYGVYVQSANSYILFFNTNSGKEHQGGSGSVAINTVNLTNEITVSGAGNTIFFLPPQPVTYLNGETTLESLDFIFTREGNNQTVRVTKYGSIDY
ncbi:MAG: prepilin-type N-terminal cleavage/methylation domain-containing protein [Candidatus Portnoybacteria bacterium]|nr:prepilin-type N-terminal cleavage/methylation domain-containing protein [Candidatus Portnoybacteria bacterium]